MDFTRSIATIFRTMNLEINKLLEPLGITGPKSTFILCIYDHKEMTQSELSKELYIDRGGVTKMLERLEKDDLIKKRQNPNDVRSILVSLTDKGETLAPKTREIQREWYTQSFPHLTEFEKNSFFELLEKAASGLDK